MIGFRELAIGAILFSFVSTPTLSLAATEATAPTQEAQLPDPGVLPDSPWYVFKQFRNWAALNLEFNKAKRASRMIDQANLRTSEAEALREKGKVEQAEKLVTRAEKLKSRAETLLTQEKERGRNIEAILEKAERHSERHEAVLKRVADQVENPTAKERILRNLDRHKAHQAALEKLRERTQLKQKRIEAKQTHTEGEPETH